MDLTDLAHAQAAYAVAIDAIDALGADGWSRPTPCEDWDVAGVTRHLITGERAFTTSLGGVRYDLPALAAEVAEVPDDDLASTYAVGASALRSALAAADPSTPFPTGIGPMAAAPIAELRTIEALVHGWDVAGDSLVVDDAAAERAIAHSLALMERLPPDRTPFGPPQPVADDAPAIDRLVALLGRRV
ncbi:TIGR03086 family metal-binding protein [Nocardioides sp. CN2-186]|uniref:TIGR03086 family metal-binding protein n=1 Tax=Nocardioides tweenelious TaxID=3156607 RepID=UPI0032B393E3